MEEGGCVLGWICFVCMYINLLIRFGCEMCSLDRLVDYVVFDGIRLDERERIRIVVEERLEVFF